MAKRILAGTAILLLEMIARATAADAPAVPLKAPGSTGFDWSGWYLGGHVGVTTGRSPWSAPQPGTTVPDVGGTLQFPLNFDFLAGTGSYYAGLQGGYNHVFPSRWLVGFEADVSAPNSDVTVPNSIAGTQVFASPASGTASYNELVLLSGTARGRVGHAFDKVMIYGTGGLAWTFDQLTRTQIDGTAGAANPGTVETKLQWRFGWALGAGVEVPLSPAWTARAEFLHTSFARSGVDFEVAAQRFDSRLAQNAVRLGVNYRIGDDLAKSDIWTKGVAPLDTDWLSLHGQATTISQYALPFRAPYRGQNSLDPNAGRETADVTFYAGVKLWQGAELWINPEIDQGFGLSNTLGAAGYVSGEAYKVGSSYPYARLHRAFLRQTIDLGGDSRKLDSGINQLASTQTADRLVITIGKFSVADLFDTNKYAHDPRGDFLNWSLISSGTFDYAADAWGYTVGAAAEWYQGPWTLRVGLFDLSRTPNTTRLDPTFEQFQWVGEIERRYELMGQPGKIAVTGYLTRGRMASLDDAIQLAAQTGNVPDPSLVRRYQSRPGISMNLEQQIVPNIGFFMRAGVADGRVETFEFTDIDRTVAAGFAFNGTLWGRNDDTLGIAGVVNAISGVREAYLNVGGLGVLIGDGQLPNPGTEKIIEAYYTLPLAAWRLTLDYQFIANPAYNRDRGPVSVLGARLRTQF